MKRVFFLFSIACGFTLFSCGSDDSATVKKSSEPLVQKVTPSEELDSESTDEDDTYSSDADYDNEEESIAVEESDYYPEEEDASISENTETAVVINEEEASLFIGRFKSAYEGLLSFKDDPTFHQTGFAQPGKFHDWIIEAQNLQDNPISEQLVSRGLIANELVILGIQYLETKGGENNTTLMFNEDFKRILY